MQNGMAVATEMTRDLTAAALDAEPGDFLEDVHESNRLLRKQLACLREELVTSCEHGSTLSLGYLRLRTKCDKLERELASSRELGD